jgi:hypothetical protein
MATNLKGVFAGGDAVTGPWIAIGAVAAGREAAISMERLFKGEDLAEDREKLTMPSGDNWNPIPLNIQKTPREHMKLRPADERKKDFMTSSNWDSRPSKLRHEGERCLNCGVCCECLQCVEACKAKAPLHEEKAPAIWISTWAR